MSQGHVSWLEGRLCVYCCPRIGGSRAVREPHLRGATWVIKELDTAGSTPSAPSLSRFSCLNIGNRRRSRHRQISQRGEAICLWRTSQFQWIRPSSTTFDTRMIKFIVTCKRPFPSAVYLNVLLYNDLTLIPHHPRQVHFFKKTFCARERTASWNMLLPVVLHR